MSIWTSVGAHREKDEVRAINDMTMDNDLRGEGEETAWVDVAFNMSYHPLLRLLVHDDPTDQEMCVLLTPPRARLLARRLLVAAEESDRNHGGRA
jgi:hypothetical protein